MNVHAFGAEHAQAVVLVHPSLVMWDYFEYVIPLMQNRYFVIVPALPGYDESTPGDFTSVEQIAEELADWLEEHGISELLCMYGCSMGGAIVARFLADKRVKVRSAVLDGGITPYQLPWIVARLIAIRDFVMVYVGKLGGLRLLEKAFTSDEYSEDDLRYLQKVLQFMSGKTIWRTFESCNNYTMPNGSQVNCEVLEYWYARTEEKARAWDIDYVRKHFPQAVFRVFDGVGHGGLAVLQPKRLVSEMERVISSTNTQAGGQA